jgi:putative DNA primase/helicase
LYQCFKYIFEAIFFCAICKALEINTTKGDKMLEAMRAMASHGFNLSNLVLDGKIHRFDGKSKNSGWYIGFENHSLKGDIYQIVKYGDWNGGDEFVYKPSGLSKADLVAATAQIAAAQKRVKDEKEQLNLDTAEKAEKILKTLKPSKIITDYMERKKIPGGQLIATDEDLNRVLKIPMYDVDGKLWNIQTVTNDSKRFMFGGKINGTFHVIGGQAKDARYICEGFATGYSIFLATGKPVIVAFNCGNLIKVSQDLVKKYHDISLIVCGDDDIFTDGNPGRTAAEKSAEACLGKAIFPKFKDNSEEKRFTDFNDLHCAEGLEAVRNILSDKPEEKKTTKHFVPLGYSGDNFYFFNLEHRIVIKISSFTNINILRIAPKTYWISRYAKGDASKFDVSEVAGSLISFCQIVGVYDPNRERGAGVWFDDGRVIVNTGREIYIDGVKTEEIFESRYLYTSSTRMPCDFDRPLTTKECEKLIDACQAIKWLDPKSGSFLAGWLAVSRVAGALQIRPHAWLTGGAGTGKSTIMNVIENLLEAPSGVLNVVGSSTEAGIRQSVKSLSIPVIFDEFETTDPSSAARIKSVVDLMRSSWSATGAVLLKGSVEGNAQEFKANFAALVSSIRVNLENDADKSRFVILELAKHGDDVEQFRVLRNKLKELDSDYGSRLFSRMITQVKNIRLSFETIRDHLATRINQRYGQQVGMILAGYHALTSDNPITDEEAYHLANGFCVDDDEVPDNDSVECLRHILTTKITIKNSFGSKDISIGDAVHLEGHHCDLIPYGVRVVDGYLAIANSHTEMSRIMNGTRWVSNWGRNLSRLPGSLKKQTRFGEFNCKSVWIPLS